MKIFPSIAPFERKDWGCSVVWTIVSFFLLNTSSAKNWKSPFVLTFQLPVWRRPGEVSCLTSLGWWLGEGFISPVWVRAFLVVQTNLLIKTSSVGAESPAPAESKLPLFPWAQPQGLLALELSAQVSRTCLAKSPKFSRHLVNGADLAKLEQTIVPFLFPVETYRRWVWKGSDTQPWKKLQKESQRIVKAKELTVTNKNFQHNSRKNGHWWHRTYICEQTEICHRFWMKPDLLHWCFREGHRELLHIPWLLHILRITRILWFCACNWELFWVLAYKSRP